MTTSRMSPLRILLVDDSAEMRSEIRSSLADQKIEWFEASDGDEVLRSYENVRPSLVLMDIRMRRVDGLTATRELLKAHPDARVITLTQYKESTYRTAAKEAGAIGFASKDDLSGLGHVILSMKRST